MVLPVSNRTSRSNTDGGFDLSTGIMGGAGDLRAGELEELCTGVHEVLADAPDVRSP